MLEIVENAFEKTPDLPQLRRIAGFGRTWLCGPDPAIIREEATLVFSHGDSNLENYLWHNGKVRLIDFEYSGWSDRPYDLADFVEHPKSHPPPPADWRWFIEQFALDAAEIRRFEAIRKLMALFWAYKYWSRLASDPLAPALFETQTEHFSLLEKLFN